MLKIRRNLHFFLGFVWIIRTISVILQTQTETTHATRWFNRVQNYKIYMNMTNESVKITSDAGRFSVFETDVTTTGAKVEPGRERFAFVRGMNAVRNKDIVSCKNELCAAMGWTTRSSWYLHLYGKIEPKVTEVETVERVFAKYGIKNVWGV